MPEGDTVHKLARFLQEKLGGQPLEGLELRDDPQVQASMVDRVWAQGKHCLIQVDQSQVIRVHLGMHGRWEHYPAGQAKLTDRVRIHLTVAGFTYLCLNPMEVERFSLQHLPRHPRLSRLGPDLLGPEPDWNHLQERLHQLAPPSRALGEVLLDQSLAAGLGNVYKSELCFLGPDQGGPAWQRNRGLCPWQAWGDYGCETVLGLYRRGRRLLLANLGGWPRTTTNDGRRPLRGKPRAWVYERAGRPCLSCQTLLRARAQGLQARPTFWCPRCQVGPNN